MDEEHFNSSDMIEEQLKVWQLNFRYCFKKPILSFYTSNFIKIMCDDLNQNLEVFLMSIDLMESFVSLQTSENKFKEDVLSIASSVLLSNKSCGQRPEIKLRVMQKTIKKLTDISTTIDEIRNEELNFLIRVSRVPSSTLLTDVNIFANYFVGGLMTKTNFEDISGEIITIYYLCRKEIYSKLEESFGTRYLKKVMSNKFFLTCGIILCGLHFTTSEETVLFNVAEKFENITLLRKEDFIFLVQTLFEYIQ